MQIRSSLNKNSVPFIILSIVHLFFFVQFMRKKTNRLGTLLLLSNIGFAYLFEYIVLNLFQAYEYKPKVIKQNYLDNIFGAILSQAMFVPVMATFLTVCKKNWKWKFGVASFYYLIEKTFLRLNVYKINWWRPKYTWILIHVYFFISDVFYKRLVSKGKKALRIAHFLSIDVIGITVIYFSAVRRSIRFGRGGNYSWKEHFIIAPLYASFLSLSALMTSSKSGLFYRVLQLACNQVLDYLLISKGILKVNIRHYIENLLLQIFMVMISRTLYTNIYEKKE